MSESESEADNSDDNDEDRPIFPYDKLYYSAQDKKDIMAMPEIQREETLSERAQQVDRHNQDLALRRLLASRSREEARAAKKAKRKAGSAGLDDNQRKSSRQKTTLGGRKVGETSGAIEAYKRQREQKGKRDELRRRDPTKSRRRSRSMGSDISDEDADAESDLELDDRVGRSVSIPKDDPPAELREIRRAQVGRNNFAKVCFYPGFENAMIGCYARLSIGPHPDSGQNEYRLGLITGRNLCRLDYFCMLTFLQESPRASHTPWRAKTVAHLSPISMSSWHTERLSGTSHSSLSPILHLPRFAFFPLKSQILQAN
jgi:Transcription factor involved in TATA site selection and in elongation by RNA polymerase II